MKLNVIGILCADIERSLRFYKLLGVPFGDYDPQEGHYAADLGGFRLMLDTHQVAQAFMPDFTPPRANDLITLAVEVDSPADVDAVYEGVLDAGFVSVREPFDAFWGQRYATVSDPDANPVDLYAPLPD